MTSPVTPGMNASGAPPAGVEITGTRANCASIKTLGSPSKSEVNKNRSIFDSQKPTQDDKPDK